MKFSHKKDGDLNPLCLFFIGYVDYKYTVYSLVCIHRNMHEKRKNILIGLAEKPEKNMSRLRH